FHAASAKRGLSTRLIGAPNFAGFPPASGPCTPGLRVCPCLLISARHRTQLSLPPLDPKSALPGTDMGLIGGADPMASAAANCSIDFMWPPPGGWRARLFLGFAGRRHFRGFQFAVMPGEAHH